MGVRRRAREVALQVLFQSEFAPQMPIRDLLERFALDFEIKGECLEYSRSLVAGVAHNRETLDAEIQSQSAHWKVARMALVDLNIMRIAIFELKFQVPPIPPSVVIDEAVEIAKKYGTNDSGSFVNGIIDQIARTSGLI